MKKYKVEPDFDGIQKASSRTRRQMKRLVLIDSHLLHIIFVGAPLMMIGFENPNLSNMIALTFLAIFLIYVLYSFVTYVSLFREKSTKLFSLFILIFFTIPVFASSVLFGVLANASIFYLALLFLIFAVFSISSLLSVWAISGQYLDTCFEGNFRKKEDGYIFLSQPEVFNTFAVAKRLGMENFYGRCINLLRFSMIIFFPLAVWTFPQVYSGEAARSGVMIWISVLLLLLYLGAQPLTLSTFVIFRAIRRREMGYGVEGG